MRTVAQLAELTGIDYETVRYYCTPEKPVNPIKGKKGRRGAGLIQATSTRGRWNLYDDDALIGLAIVGLMGKSGMSVEDMRKALTWDVDHSQLMKEQEGRLEKKLQEVDRELRTAGVLRRFFEAFESDDDAAIMRSIQDCGMLALEGLEGRIEKDARLAPLRDLEPSEAVIESSKEIYILLENRRSIERRGGNVDELERVDQEIASLTLAQTEGNLLGEMMTSLEELWKAGKPHDDPEALQRVEEFHRGEMALFQNLTAERLEALVRANITGSYFSLMLELACGEGFISFVMETVECYCKKLKSREEECKIGRMQN